MAIFMLSWAGEKRDAARLNGYLVRADAKEVFGVLDGSFPVRVELLDAAGKAITEGEVVPQRFSITGTPIKRETWFAHLPSERGGIHNFGGKKLFSPPILFLSPAYGHMTSGGEYTYSGASAVENNLTLSVTDAELKRLKQVRCTAQFKARK